jgi:hypothetical protein
MGGAWLEILLVIAADGYFTLGSACGRFVLQKIIASIGRLLQAEQMDFNFHSTPGCSLLHDTTKIAHKLNIMPHLNGEKDIAGQTKIII